jgi:hypothetical protein
MKVRRGTVNTVPSNLITFTPRSGPRSPFPKQRPPRSSPDEPSLEQVVFAQVQAISERCPIELHGLKLLCGAILRNNAAED